MTGILSTEATAKPRPTPEVPQRDSNDNQNARETSNESVVPSPKCNGITEKVVQVCERQRLEEKNVADVPEGAATKCDAGGDQEPLSQPDDHPMVFLMDSQPKNDNHKASAKSVKFVKSPKLADIIAKETVSGEKLSHKVKNMITAGDCKENIGPEILKIKTKTEEIHIKHNKNLNRFNDFYKFGNGEISECCGEVTCSLRLPVDIRTVLCRLKFKNSNTDSPGHIAHGHTERQEGSIKDRATNPYLDILDRGSSAEIVLAPGMMLKGVDKHPMHKHCNRFCSGCMYICNFAYFNKITSFVSLILDGHVAYTSQLLCKVIL